MTATIGQAAMIEQARSVRDFNRYYSQRIGLLTDRYLGQDRPLSEARLLYEIGTGAPVRDLRTRLGWDSGYLSRSLRSLEGQGLVQLRAHETDRRVRVAELTAAGTAELAELERRSTAAASELLAPLTAAQRAELITAQHRTRRLLRLAAVTVELTDADSASARHCLAEYAAELSTRFPEGYDSRALVDPAEVGGAGGAFLVAYEHDNPIGCGGIRTYAPGVAELCHLWVHADARGLGLGRRLLAELERQAVTRDLHTVRLGTHGSLAEAAALYRSAGYRQIPVYGDSPYNQLCFERVVADDVPGKALPSLDGRRFRAVGEVDGGEVDAATVFDYRERGGEVSATYAGGSVRTGHLVGTRDGDTLDFRYVQLNTAGQTSTGHCVSRISVLPDGRLRLDETWSWESREGSGTSTVEEVG
ncbi:MarR family winged helix-turn-helix transcriptional regulator [Plantactinospora sp. KLBMP9567]|uniref:bifunctional helix-turn-helix transcriptional regulator/GNAT family N-acetyltransferase n=1 Tax=Plantactinospora sp. KLBMP9567 TaxID=3085900 RepID=UPI002981F272|nr:MarR family winged helix-turn-helix transcriptional regulator [Plantactinospora sp. KLBMP9567]MDW5329845.1 MarR family winged helix-turn-helix transcriptional regulator [Plantactinospora sp. KLBMP9567]